MEGNTQFITGRVHPHSHKDQFSGPYSLRIGKTSLPPLVERWTGKSIYLSIVQPNDDTNYTEIRVLYRSPGHKTPASLKSLTFHRARCYRRKSGEVEVRIKKRLTDSFPHPLPTGQYVGSSLDNEGVAVLTFQQVSLRKSAEPAKPKTIITPGDKEFDVAIADAKTAFRGVDGVDGGGPNPGGLHYG
jgi:hypothetical protein